MTKELAVLMAGDRMGVLSQGDGGALDLAYEDSYRQRPLSMPVSLSMPLSWPSQPPAVVRAFCQGLLPDNENVLERWARDFQVSAGNPFALLTHVGEDCAGAVQFVRPERVDAILANVGSVVPLTDEQIAARLRTLRRDPSAWHMASAGQFSLAGAQAKTALHFDPSVGQWGDPSGAVPTTHIIKPAIAGFDGHDLNEHLCLSAARIVGIRAAGTDAHAKNYSVLHLPGQVRLAPLYDVASSLPYDDMYLPRLRLAMRIGSEYRVEAITGRHWTAFSERNGLDPARVAERVDELGRRLPAAFREAAASAPVAALKSDLPGRLVSEVEKHVERCRAAMAKT
jgi:HipA-like protein